MMDNAEREGTLRDCVECTHCRDLHSRFLIRFAVRVERLIARELLVERLRPSALEVDGIQQHCERTTLTPLQSELQGHASYSLSQRSDCALVSNILDDVSANEQCLRMDQLKTDSAHLVFLATQPLMILIASSVFCSNLAMIARKHSSPHRKVQRSDLTV